MWVWYVSVLTERRERWSRDARCILICLDLRNARMMMTNIEVTLSNYPVLAGRSCWNVSYQTLLVRHSGTVAQWHSGKCGSYTASTKTIIVLLSPTVLLSPHLGWDQFCLEQYITKEQGQGTHILPFPFPTFTKYEVFRNFENFEKNDLFCKSCVLTSCVCAVW